MKIHLFWIGILSALLYRQTMDGSGRDVRQAVTLTSLTVAVFLLPYAQNIGLLLWLGFMVMLSGRSTALRQAFSFRPLVAAGSISYPLYLLHEVVIWTIIAFWKQGSWSEIAVLMVCVVAVTGLLASVLHICIEKPANRLARRLVSYRR